MRFLAAIPAALLAVLPAPALADTSHCVVSPEICARIAQAYQVFEQQINAGERAIRDLVSPVLPSCTASVDTYVTRDSLVIFVGTEQAQVAEYGVAGTNNGSCPAEQHEPPASPEGTAICTVFVFGDVAPAAGSDGDVDGNCLATASTTEVPFAAAYTVEGYTFGDTGVLPGHDLETYFVYCLPDDCVEA